MSEKYCPELIFVPNSNEYFCAKLLQSLQKSEEEPVKSEYCPFKHYMTSTCKQSTGQISTAKPLQEPD